MRNSVKHNRYKICWLCLNLLCIVDYFKSTTRVICKQNHVAGVTISTSFGCLPAGGRCCKRTVATLYTLRTVATLYAVRTVATLYTARTVATLYTARTVATLYTVRTVATLYTARENTAFAFCSRHKELLLVGSSLIL
jgi:hypothetical protein